MILLALLILSLGWVLYLRLTDQPLRDPFGFYRPAPEVPSTPEEEREDPVMPPAEGKVRVLISARTIPAYERVSRDDLFDPKRARLAFMDLDEEFVDKNDVLIGATPIVGRVMKRDKRAGFPFTEADFLPKGTRPGLTAGIPKGKRALRIPVDFVQGIIGLNPGDRFDLVAARTVTPKAAVQIPASTASEQPSFSGVYSDLVPRASDPAPKLPRSKDPEARVDVVVQGGVVVTGLETRLVPTSSTSLTAGQITGTRPVQEMVIALAPEEVAPLMAALRLESDLTCVARSGRPDDPEDSVTPGLVPDFGEDEDDGEESAAASAAKGTGLPAGYADADFTIVETIVGGERKLTAVPKANAEGDER